MRVAAISDIHGNLPALEAVLADIEREGVDAIVVAGDSVSGPWPAEVFDLLGSVRARRPRQRRPAEVVEAQARARGLECERLGDDGGSRLRAGR